MKLIQKLHLVAIAGNQRIPSNVVNCDVAERIYRKNRKIKQSIDQTDSGEYLFQSGKRSLGKIGGKNKEADQNSVNAHKIDAGHHGYEAIGFAENTAQIADVDDGCPHAGNPQVSSCCLILAKRLYA